MKLRWIFLNTLVLTIAYNLAMIYSDRPKPTPKPQQAEFHPLTNRVFLTSQMDIHGIADALAKGIQTIVSVRPDGEAEDQTPSKDIEYAVSNLPIQFHYIPVPSDHIPDKAVDSLIKVVAESPKPILLYCRTGNRAARLYAMAEASRSDGPDLNSILKMVSNAKFNAEDIKAKLTERISKRPLITKGPEQ